MRGQRGIQPVDVVPRRIIPARAGPTARRCCPCVGRADHPRSCGANFHDNSRNAQPFGSSPFVRGQQVLGFVPPGRVRIIPARAGPTQVLRITTHPMADHPRSCGANAGQVLQVTALGGSSPLVRGQPGQRHIRQKPQRIIPARAGPTFIDIRLKVALTDHPRSCGANVVRIRRLTVLTGSSPLVRGQRRTVVLPRFAVRIIPARAGPTLGRRLVENHRTGSSPLVRGQPAHATYYLGVRGSSPLVRGQLSETAAEQEGNWIIPARAGPTSPTWCPKARSTDHPRSCGANIFSYMKGCDMDGSSPLVRGQLSPSSLSNHSFRIIPARAGPTG